MRVRNVRNSGFRFGWLERGKQVGTLGVCTEITDDVCQDIAQLHTSLQHDIKPPDMPAEGGSVCVDFGVDVPFLVVFSCSPDNKGFLADLISETGRIALQPAAEKLSSFNCFR